tara:strand:+ start:24 stop:827 length:804 start_codon:yes stop_codon:yes gene_type:complete
MKKNIVWWPAVINPEHSTKYGGYNYFDYSRKTWEYWCKKNDVLFVPFTEPVEGDLIRFRVNWQKCLFVFDELERLGIEYDKIALIDSTAMIKWDAPNFFELADNRFTAWRDIDNMKWVYDSIQGYKKFFNDFNFDYSKYFNSGLMIFNDSHREVFQALKEFYYKNIDEICNLQDNIVHKGNDQTPLNYWLQMNNIEMNLELPNTFNLTHMHRREAFTNNWQLDNSEFEDKTPHFIKYGYVWRFTGIPKEERSNLMKQTWDLVGSNYE